MLIFQGPHRGSVVGDLIAGPIPVPFINYGGA